MLDRNMAWPYCKEAYERQESAGKNLQRWLVELRGRWHLASEKHQANEPITEEQAGNCTSFGWLDETVPRSQPTTTWATL